MITDLQNKVKELENKIEQKDHQIKELQNDLSVIYELFLPDILEKSYKKVTYYIPIKKAWEMIENNKEWILRDSPNGYIKVKVDSVYKDGLQTHLYLLVYKLNFKILLWSTLYR